MSELKIAAGYVRVSTDDQLEFSPDAQRNALRKWAADNGYFIPQEFMFCDEGISGRKAEKRPGFMEMIATAKRKDHPFEAILVHKFDRFARSREDSVVYKSLLRKECGVRVISITESVEDDKFSVILEAMLEAMAEYYSMNLAEEVKKGMTEKALKGGRQCVPPFGYCIDDKKEMVPHPDEAPIVQEIFRRYLDGEALYHVAQDLNSRGIKTHRGNAMENRTLEYILRNPVYIGKLRWNPTGRTRRKFDDENLIVATGTHPPIIDEKTFYEVENKMRLWKQLHTRHTRPNTDRKHWLCGIVRCASCGCTLIASKNYTKTGGRTFLCNGTVHGKCDSPNRIRVDILEEAFLRQLEADQKDPPEFKTKIIPSGKKGDELQTIQQAFRRLNAKQDRIREAYLQGIDSVEEYKSAKELLRQEEADLKRRLEQLESRASEKTSRKAMASAITSVLKTLKDETLDVGKKHDALFQLIDTCTWDKSTATLSITYRLTI